MFLKKIKLRANQSSTLVHCELYFGVVRTKLKLGLIFKLKLSNLFLTKFSIPFIVETKLEPS
jgi:hypothetical protein